MAPYNNKIKVGEIITSYKTGYFKVTKIEKRFYTKDDEKSFDFLEQKLGRRPEVGEEYSPIIHSRKLLTAKFKKRAGKESCDASYCSKLDPLIYDQVQTILDADPSIEENSYKKFTSNELEPKLPSTISNCEVTKVIDRLNKCKTGQNVEKLLAYICPTLFTDIKLSNGYINSDKQFAVHLNQEYVLSIIYDEKESKTTEFVSGKIYKKNT